jgi:hypothetical protein
MTETVWISRIQGVDYVQNEVQVCLACFPAVRACTFPLVPSHLSHVHDAYLCTEILVLKTNSFSEMLPEHGPYPITQVMWYSAAYVRATKWWSALWSVVPILNVIFHYGFPCLLY